MQRVCSANAAPMRADASIDMDILFQTIREVETGGHPDPALAIGDGGTSLGPYQIGRAYWIDSGVDVEYEDVRRDDAARAVMLAYWTRYAPRPWTYESLARMHNGGPRGPERKATMGYWIKCMTVIDRIKSGR